MRDSFDEPNREQPARRGKNGYPDVSRRQHRPSSHEKRHPSRSKERDTYDGRTQWSGRANPSPDPRHTPSGTRPRTGGARSHSEREASRPRENTPRTRGSSSRTPSYYDPRRAPKTSSPRASLDKSLDNARWGSSSSTDVYVGGKKRRNPVPFVIGGAALALALIVVFALNLSSGGQQNSPSEPDEAALVANEKSLEPVTFTVSFAGDCTLGTDSSFDQSTSFNARYDAVADPSYFFSNVVGIFEKDDLTVVNMEGTLTTSTTREDKTFAFKGPAEYANVLLSGNVEAASLANNHSHDYGAQSYTDTISAVETAGIPTFGYERIAYFDIKGVKVALVGTYELAEGIGIKDEMTSNIRKAREEGADVVMVYFHWGMEREYTPNETQIELGHSAVDAGADLVIGSHPHVIQGYEKYNGRYIVYSLGNFCFGGNSNPSDKDCMIFQQTFTVTGDDVATDDAIEVIPCSISSSSTTNNYQPTPATGEEKTRIEEKIRESSEAIASLSSSVSST